MTSLPTYLALVAAARAIEQLQSVRAADLSELQRQRELNIKLSDENRALRQLVQLPGKDAT